MGPLSIGNSSPLALWRRDRSGIDKMGADGDGTKTPAQAYALNLAKLIPGDTIALYTLLGQLKPPSGGWANYHIAPFLCCIVLIVFRALATRGDDGKPRWALVFLSLLTFICWIYAQNDWFWDWKVNDFGSYVFNAALLTLAFLAPAVVGKDT